MEVFHPKHRDRNCGDLYRDDVSMEQKILVPLLLVLLSCTFCAADFPPLETPEYTVLKTGKDFEIRSYKEAVWAVAMVDDFSFVHATQAGFHRLFQYIEGGNHNWTKIPMTAPVLTGIVPSAGPFCSSAFAVRFYVPPKFRNAPPTPLEELDITFEHWDERTVAVRTFPGYAKDDNVPQEAEKLSISLSNSDFAKDSIYPIEGLDSYAIAQYSGPFQIFNRKNEVWVNIKLDNKTSGVTASS
ncbi:hypothetical protein R1flu_024699 [Riccia fluitans]|uniref:Heme-binding protein 2 n=1 Tax=Riccia fluitans TaxID=41844 RepID=A0ABD1XVN2_9MARC